MTEWILAGVSVVAAAASGIFAAESYGNKLISEHKAKLASRARTEGYPARQGVPPTDEVTASPMPPVRKAASHNQGRG
jgi:hypothetical protein